MHLLDSIKKSRVLPLEMKLYPDANHSLYNAVNQKREAYVEAIVQWVGKQM